MSIRKALGAVKDQTTIGIAKVTSAVSPDLDIAVVRATSHDDSAPLDGCRHADQVLRLLAASGGSRAHVAACASSVARRLVRTRDYVVAAKCLALVHRLVAEGDPQFRLEVLRPAPSSGRRAGGEPLLALLADFRDEAHTASWDHSAFVRAYAAYLDARVRFLVDSRHPTATTHRVVRFADDPIASSSSSPLPPPSTLSSVHDMDTESLLSRARQLRDLLDRLLACRPSGAARTSRVVLAALAPLLNDSFQLHADVAVVLAVLLDRFFEMEYHHCVRAFEAYVGAAKQVDQLLGFYAWCSDLGVARSADFPEVNRIEDTLLETLEQFLRERGRAGQNQSSQPPKTLQHGRVQDYPEPAAAAEYDDMNNAVMALPAPERNATAPTAQKESAAAANKSKKLPADDQSEQLVDLRDPAADDQGNKLALALFNAPPPPTNNGDWVAFSEDDDDKVTSAWQTPAAEPGKADWELALVETASTLSRQKAALGGGLDPLLLGGMYDQGVVRRHHVAAQAAASSGSASSVAAFPGRGSSAPVLALPAPDGTVQMVGGDPFAASLAVPPPSYVQMAEMERKQHLLVQEQLMWAQYRQGGMQGQIAGGGVFASTNSSVPMPYYGYGNGMPAMAYNQVGGYY